MEQSLTTVCVECGGGLTRSKYTPDHQPIKSQLCASCYYNQMHPQAHLMELGELESLIRNAGENPVRDFFTSLVGQLVDWHGTPASICLINNTIKLEIDLTCRCGVSGPTVYMGEGLHNGAWPYAYNLHGIYLMNTRDQEYVCDTCMPAHQATLVRISTMRE